MIATFNTCLICMIFIWKQYEPFYPRKKCGMQLLSIAFQIQDDSLLYFNTVVHSNGKKHCN